MDTEFDQRVKMVSEYLEDILVLKDNEKGYITSAVVYVHEAVPTEIGIIFKKQEAIVASMEDMSYLIMRLKGCRQKINNKYKELKDPVYTSLVLKGRPSDTARDCESRNKVPEIRELESKLETIDFIIEYITYIKDSLNKLYLDIRDRLMMSK